jgi:chromosome segregation ATPase
MIRSDTVNEQVRADLEVAKEASLQAMKEKAMTEKDLANLSQTLKELEGLRDTQPALLRDRNDLQEEIERQKEQMAALEAELAQTRARNEERNTAYQAQTEELVQAREAVKQLQADLDSREAHKGSQSVSLSTV